MNIVLFVPDEMRADSLSIYGNPVARTPNFERLAAMGTVFDQCHVQFPVCGASRCSFLTGWPASVRGHRSLYYFLRPEEPNLFRYLRRAGYDVYWFGKNDALAAASFAESVTYWSETGARLAGLRRDYPALATPGVCSFLFEPMADGPVRDEGLVRAAIEVLERPSERPFCLFIPLSQPHPPYTVPEPYYSLHDPAALPPPAPPGLPGKPNFHAAIRETYGLTGLGEETFRKIRSVYLGQVSYCDWLLGELIDAMERTGRLADTALFACSDHGDYAGDYGLVEKWPSGLEDCLTRVPLAAYLPGGAAGHVSREIVELYDVMAACLDLAGARASHTHFARSLAPQLAGRPGDAGRAAFAEGGYNVYEPQCFEPDIVLAGPYGPKLALQNRRPETITRSAMVRTRGHKLIERPSGASELYDLAADPGELRNLIDDPALAETREALRRRLLYWYLNTTGVAPWDKDSRGQPPFYPTGEKPPFALADWLDRA